MFIMRTLFTFDDDKQLVQLARAYIDGGSRISWAGIAYQMKCSGHTASALKQRLRTLMRTYGNGVTRFPQSFFTQVRRPRGRPPAVTRQLRALASVPQPRGRLQNADPSSERVIPSSAPHKVPSLQSHGSTQIGDEIPAAAAGLLAVAGASKNAQGAMEQCSVGMDTGEVEQPEVVDATGLQVSVAGGVTKLRRPAAVDAENEGSTDDNSASTVDDDDSQEEQDVPEEKGPPPLSPAEADKAVTTIFADIPRAVVTQDHNKPHQNVGELMPDGVTKLLSVVGAVDECDLFLDIGAGVGNVVAQVGLATKVHLAIGVEIRRDIHELGTRMIAKSPNVCRLRERTQFGCDDIMNIRFSFTLPYADASVIYWNNLLFEPQVIEYVKDQLCDLFLVRVLVSCLDLSPRHRDICRSCFARRLSWIK